MIIPQDQETELALLSAALVDLQSVMLECTDLSPEAFVSPAHAAIWSALLGLGHAGGHHADLPVISAKLGGDSERFTPALYNALEATGIPALAGQYKGILQEKHYRRRLLSAAHRLLSQTQSEEPLDEALAHMGEAMQQTSVKGATPVKPLVKEAAEQIDAEVMSSRHVSGLDTGYENLNKITGGLKSQNLILIAARPSNGKTTLAMNIATHVAAVEGKPVLVFSLEQSGVELTKRQLAAMSGVNLRELRYSADKDAQFSKITSASSKLAGLPLYIDDRGGLTTSQIRAEARRLKAKHGLALVVVDYIGLIRPANPRTEILEHITRTSADLKLMAKELGVPVMALSQLNRKADADGRRPKLHDLRDSGSLEQDADMVILLSRKPSMDELPDKLKRILSPADLERISVVDVAKNRDGATAPLFMWFDRTTTSFRTMEFGGATE